MNKIPFGIFLLLALLSHFYLSGPMGWDFDPAESDNKPVPIASIEADGLA